MRSDCWHSVIIREIDGRGRHEDPITGSNSADSFIDLTCTSAARCVSIGEENEYVVVNPSTPVRSFAMTITPHGESYQFTAPASEPNPRYDGVACSAPAYCVAAGEDSLAAANGAGWRYRQASLPPTVSSDGVEPPPSCATNGFCMAVAGSVISEITLSR